MNRRNGGFTLMEMLIVVALIGILISIAIPVLGNQLEAARVATDQANARSAYAAALAEYLYDGTPAWEAYRYDAGRGLVSASGRPTGYGQSSNPATYEVGGVTVTGTPKEGGVANQ